MLKRVGLNLLIISILFFTFTGCTSMQESFASQMEVPTLERQANRVAIGMAVVRENNIMSLKMPISSDAKWPVKISTELTEKEKKKIVEELMKGPFFSTVHYTDVIQREYLGSSALMSSFGDYGNLAAHIMDQKVSPITYRAVHKLQIFYGEKRKNWPDIFNFDSSVESFLDFKDSKMVDIESPSGDVYESIGEAMISLAPLNLQKELHDARLEMLSSSDNLARAKGERGELESEIKIDKVKGKREREIKQDINRLEVEIEELESVAKEKELIYFELIDIASVALESDINIADENYVKLAKNINLVSREIKAGSLEAYTSFGLAATNLISSNILLNFPRELESLAIAKINIPANLQDNYNKRLQRLAKNAIYLIPNIAIGTYYASKQLSLAGKYQDITDVILQAYKTKLEQDEASRKVLDKSK